MKFGLITTLGFAALPGQFTFAQTWTLTSAPITNWHAVASSADGTCIDRFSSYGLGNGLSWMRGNSCADSDEELTQSRFLSRQVSLG